MPHTFGIVDKEESNHIRCELLVAVQTERTTCLCTLKDCGNQVVTTVIRKAVRAYSACSYKEHDTSRRHQRHRPAILHACTWTPCTLTTRPGLTPSPGKQTAKHGNPTATFIAVRIAAAWTARPQHRGHTIWHITTVPPQIKTAPSRCQRQQAWSSHGQRPPAWLECPGTAGRHKHREGSIIHRNTKTDALDLLHREVEDHTNTEKHTNRHVRATPGAVLSARCRTLHSSFTALSPHAWLHNTPHHLHSCSA